MLIANRPKMARYTVMLLIVLVMVMIGCTYCGGKAPEEGVEGTEGSTASTSEKPTEEELTMEEPTTEEPTTAEPETEEEIPRILTDLTAHYLRGGDSSETSITRVIRTAEEYEAYCEEEKRFVSGEEFQKIADRFDKAFWENYDLTLTGCVVGSGSIRHEVLSMTREESSDKGWIINVRPLIPGVYTTDMAAWTFAVEVPEGVLKEDEAVQMNYVMDSKKLYVRGITYVRTDMWRPEDADESWYLNETPLYCMETKEELKAYCEAHPELSEGFIELCGKYDDQFWKERDLLLVVQREESSSVRYEVGDLFKNQVLGSDTWFIEWVKKIPETQTTDAAVWHVFIEVDDKYNLAENEIRIHEREVLMEDKELIDAQYLYSENDAVVETDPKIRLISSQEQLDQFYEANKDKYNLTERWANSSYKKIKEKYNPVFWEQNDLILVTLEGNVGPYWYTVAAIEWQSDQPGECKMTIESTAYYPEPKVILAYRHLFVAVPKGDVAEPGMVSLEFVEGTVEHVN